MWGLALLAGYVFITVGFGHGFPFFQSTVLNVGSPLSGSFKSWSNPVHYGIALLIAISGAALSWVFHRVVELLTRVTKPNSRPLKLTASVALVLGMVLVFFLYSPWGQSSQGLGLDSIRRFFLGHPAIYEPFSKTLATAWSIGIGLKGGEYTPLLFMGTSLGTLFIPYAELGAGVFAAIGFTAVFSHATKCPLASACLGIGLGGVGSLPFVILAAFTSFWLGGRESLYLIPSAHRWRIRLYFL
ncbi:MAG: hypothetical protein EOP09_12575 [Proteobacteria bacterium]|nr:MAG: hypothetical protein EOP09_12575 [Pseudomonadota bacterium]